MRQSNFAAAAFAVLIAAVLAFVAGYYVGGHNAPAPPAPQPVALSDPLEQPADRQGSGPLEADVAQPTPTPEPTPKLDPAAKPQPEVHAETPPAPAPGPTVAPDSDTDEETRDLSDLLKKVAESDPELIITGPKVPCTVTVGGVVMDSNGAPVAGATVYATKGEVHESSSGGRIISLAFTGGDNSGPSIATTDSAGRFTATVSMDVSEGSSMRLTLTADATGYARSKPSSVTLKHGDTREGIELRVRGAGSVAGRVVDGSGVGVAGVSVSLRESEQAEGTGSFRIFGVLDGPGPHSAVTDASGEFIIEGVPEGQYSYELSGAGFKQLSGPTAQTVQADTRNAAPAEFVVQRVTSLAALLENDRGALTGGLARVELIDASGKLERIMPGRVRHDGLLELNEPPTGSFQIKISVSGYAPYTGQVHIFDGQRADMGTIRLERAEGQTPSRVVLPD